MVRKLAAALLGVGVFIPGLANALGLGEIKLNSALSEPLDAEIELVQVRELTSTEILPSLAGQEDFKSSGIERSQFLTDLRFEVSVNEKGKSVIKVRSHKPVKEPFLNFLVEVNWPAGRLLREYTLLLDPPIYSKQKASPVKQATTATTPKKAAPGPSAQAPDRSRQVSMPDTMDITDADSRNAHTISSNDSLWSIANTMKPSDGVSVQQTMIALQRINPEAFIDNNINLMRKGQVLRAPSEAEALEVPSRDAIQMVAEQNRLWRDRVAARRGASSPEARQIDLTGRSTDTAPSKSRASSDGRLKLLSGSEEGSGDSGQGGVDTGAGELRNKLSVAEENVDKFKLENEDLKVKMNDLEDQLHTSEKVLTLKDQQIAALQAKLAELDKQSKAMEAAAKSAPAEVAPVNAEIDETPAETSKLATPTPETETAQVEEPAQPEVDFNYQEEPATDTAESTPSDETESAVDSAVIADEEPEMVVEQPAPAEPKPVPQPVPAPVSQPDLLSEIMGNPVYLGAGAGAIVLLVLAGLLIARRKKASDDEMDDALVEDFEMPSSDSDDLNGDLDMDFEDAIQDEDAELDNAVAEQTVPQTADVLGEADIYIAYGRYPQAIEMLQNAALKEPDRADIHLKLCEVCADANEPDVFMNHYRALQDLGDAAALRKAEDLRARVAPGDDFEEAFSEEAVSEEVSTEVDAFDFDIGESDETLVAAALDQESDTGLDFDLGDLEDTGAKFTSEPANETSADSLDFNLDMDDEPMPATGSAQTEDALDFDLDMPSDSAPAAPADDLGSLDFDAEFSLDAVDEASSSSPAPMNFEEDLSLDFDQVETAATSAPVAEDNSMDFDLDFDVEPAESKVPNSGAEDLTILSMPSSEDDGAADSVLDSASAAQLADELDLDVNFGSDELDATIQAPAIDVPKPVAPVVAPIAPLQAANDIESSEDELDFLSDSDETSTKLDLARAYIDMGDRDGARDILDEVLIEGSDTQKQEAKDLLARLES